MERYLNLKHIKLNTFWSTILTLVVVYLFLRFGVAILSMWITGAEEPQPVPGTLMAMYMGLALLAVVVQLAVSDQALGDFARPIANLLRGPESVETRGDLAFQVIRWAVLIAFPLAVGWFVYTQTVPRVSAPVAGRIQHPTLPRAYEALENPFRQLPPEEQQAMIEEGRILYQKNCRPCHGTRADGRGPMAQGFRLKPVDFTDPGTIATLVESYPFWRIQTGGLRLPDAATPWDSAMPAWEDELSEEEIWKIIMAEYDIADKEPRKPERIGEE